jgi:Zn-dependent protease
VDASWPLGAAFGVSIRVHWMAVLFPAVLFGLFVRGAIPVQDALIWALPATFAYYLSVWTHEMAHVWTARRLGAKPTIVTLSPLGGLAHPETPARTPNSEILVALAGPVSQVLWTLALAGPYFAFDVRRLAETHQSWAQIYEWFAGWQAALVVLNLIPCWPMDAGRALRGLLARRMSPWLASMWTANVGYGLSVALALSGAFVWAGFRIAWNGPEAMFMASLLVYVGVRHFFACRQLQNESRPTPSSHPAGAAEAWKPGRGEEPWKESIVESERLARAEERRERRAAEARRQEETLRRRLQDRIDALLDRINEVGGVENLTPGERRELAEASELLRRETASAHH